MAGRTYRYFAETPLYPFGYGLSFSSFAYSDVKVSQAQIAADGTVAVSVRVSNGSSVAGDEVVQLYLSHPDVDGAPIRALAGFQRIHLDAGAAKTVEFSLHERDLSVVDEAGIRRIAPGTVDAWVGGGQPVAGPGQPQTKGARATFKITSGATLAD
jgi:beta-glucosidase